MARRYSTTEPGQPCVRMSGRASSARNEREGSGRSGRRSRSRTEVGVQTAPRASRSWSSRASRGGSPARGSPRSRTRPRNLVRKPSRRQPGLEPVELGLWDVDPERADLRTAACALAHCPPPSWRHVTIGQAYADKMLSCRTAAYVKTECCQAAPDTTARPRGPGPGTLSELVVHVFRLNGLLTAAGDAMAAPAGQTSARWRVLAAIEGAPPRCRRSPGLVALSAERPAGRGRSGEGGPRHVRGQPRPPPLEASADHPTASRPSARSAGRSGCGRRARG